MRENRCIAVFAFTRAYEEQEFYKRLEQEGWEAVLTACENLEGTNCYCGEAAAEALRERIQAFGLSGIHFLDSGNYHYVSRLWLEQAEEPFDLLVFDHHTDMQEPAFGGILSCGGWVRAALEELPLLRQVYLAGPPADSREAREELFGFMDRVLWIPGEELGDGEVLERYLAAEGDGCRPLYISVDKDILRMEDAVTNWDQGKVELSALLKSIRAAGRARRVLGMDVCGEEPEGNAAAEKNDRANEALCRVFSSIV